MKNWIRFLILVLFSLLVSLMIHQRITRRENVALHLKNISLNGKSKITSIKPMVEKLSKKLISANNSHLQSADQNIEPQTDKNIEPEEKKNLIGNIDFSEASLKDINNYLDVADQILIQDSQNYEVLRIKLILLLIKEQKFNQIIRDEEVNIILEQLVLNTEKDDTVSRREASLISVGEVERDILVSKYQMISEELWLLGNQSEPVDQGLLKIRKFELEKIQNEIDQLDQRTQEQMTNNFIQPDDKLFEIPLQRMLANKQYQYVIDDSLELIEKFPHMISGYFYLIRALDLNGESESANEILKQVPLSFSEHQLLQQRLNQASTVNPADFWHSLL